LSEFFTLKYKIDALQMPAASKVVSHPLGSRTGKPDQPPAVLKNFLGLPFSQPAPDHSTFSRFCSRLPKAAMDAINSEILRQFEQQGLFINEGVAVDARLVKSGSRPLSQVNLKSSVNTNRLKRVSGTKTASR
jgi:hypothetical protein